MSSDPRGAEAFADSVSQGVFVLRKAPTVSKRVTARKSFVPLVPDETHEGMEARRDAYLRCWRDTDAHIEGVLLEANQDAFEKLQGFVRGGFERRQALVAANHGRVPQHAAQRIPVGLVLAGGVNSDDHEETFSKLTAHLRRVGCHTALLRSRDLKARGGGAAAAAAAVAAADAREGGGGGGEDTAGAAAYVAGAPGGSAGGGLGVAVRRILEQLRAGAARDASGVSERLRVSGRSVRHLKRWYREVTEPFPFSGALHSVAAPETPEQGSDPDASLARADATLDSPRDDKSSDDAPRTGSRSAAKAPTREPGRRARSPPAPVAIVVEDTEGFDARVLGDLLLALSDASDEMPVTVLLGVATSANMVHGMLPAATAARLDARAFKLYSPKKVMAAVQTRVLMDPARAPALSNAALELLATRFKEHDFSLSAARRAVHLLTLEHFMYQPLAAAAPAAVAAAAAAAAAERAERAAHLASREQATHEPSESDRDSKGNDDARNPLEPLFCLEDVARDVARDDAAVNAADPARDTAAVSALAARSARVAAAAAAVAEAAAVEAADAWLTPKSVQWAKKHLGLGTKDAVARALRDAFPARKRWGLAVRCVAAGAAASGVQKGELSALFVDASAAKWMTDASQGQALLRLICARLERDDTSVSAIRAAVRRWARLVALEPAMHAEYGEDLRRAAELCDRAAAEADARREGADSVDTLSRPPPPPPPPNEEARDCVATRGGTRGGASASPAKEARARAGDVDDGDEREGESPKDTLGGVEETPAPAKKNAASVLPPAPPSTRACRRSGHPAAAAAGALASDVAGDAHGLTSPDGARAVAAALVARRRAGPERARALELAAAARGKRRREDRFANALSSPPDDAIETTTTTAKRTTSRRESRGGASGAAALESTAADEGAVSVGATLSVPGAADVVDASTAARRAACAFLRAVAGAHASRPPCSLPGHEIFCVTSTWRLREAVQAAPRLLLEQQMANPQPFLRCGCCPPGGGASATLPDCCAAYTLLQDAGDAANAHEWFRAFCEMHAPGTKAKAPARRARGAAGKDARGAEALSDDEPGGTGEPNKNSKETFSLEKQRLWELQARFTRAAAELEFLGVARPVKRRKVEYMQRTAFPLDQLLGEDGA